MESACKKKGNAGCACLGFASEAAVHKEAGTGLACTVVPQAAPPSRLPRLRLHLLDQLGNLTTVGLFAGALLVACKPVREGFSVARTAEGRIEGAIGRRACLAESNSKQQYSKTIVFLVCRGVMSLIALQESTCRTMH